MVLLSTFNVSIVEPKYCLQNGTGFFVCVRGGCSDSEQVNFQSYNLHAGHTNNVDNKHKTHVTLHYVHVHSVLVYKLS